MQPLCYLTLYSELLFKSLYFPKICNYTSLYSHIVSGANVDLTSSAMLVLSIYNYTSLYGHIVSGASVDPTLSAMLLLSIVGNWKLKVIRLMPMA
jgi:hypothetical protein